MNKWIKITKSQCYNTFCQHTLLKTKPFQENMRLVESLPHYSLHYKLNFAESTFTEKEFLLLRFSLSGSDSSRCCLWLLIALPEELPNFWCLQATSWWIFGNSRSGGKDIQCTMYITRLLKYNQEILLHRDEKSTHTEFWYSTLAISILMSAISRMERVYI